LRSDTGFSMKRLFFFLALLIGFSGEAIAANGYRLYAGTSTGVYLFSTTDVGMAQAGTVMGLTPGTVYYFAATAYIDTAESLYSNEVSGTAGLSGRIGFVWDISTDVPINRQNAFFTTE